jgi:hypothetical protein
MTPTELAVRLSAMDWSSTSLQHQLAISAAVTTLSGKDMPVSYPYQPGDPRFDGADAFECHQTFPLQQANHCDTRCDNVIDLSEAFLRERASRGRTVRLLHLDGTPFVEKAFKPGPADAPWAWIRETVAGELGCAPESVGCVDAPEGGGDLVTVDGLPVYCVDFPF